MKRSIIILIILVFNNIALSQNRCFIEYSLISNTTQQDTYAIRKFSVYKSIHSESYIYYLEYFDANKNIILLSDTIREERITFFKKLEEKLIKHRYAGEFNTSERPDWMISYADDAWNLKFFTISGCNKLKPKCINVSQLDPSKQCWFKKRKISKDEKLINSTLLTIKQNLLRD